MAEALGVHAITMLTVPSMATKARNRRPRALASSSHVEHMHIGLDITDLGHRPWCRPGFGFDQPTVLRLV